MYTRVNSVYQPPNPPPNMESKRLDKLTRHAELSEKALEQYLQRQTMERGGICLKYFNPHATGYPDRICILPQGRTIWVELKSHGARPTKMQTLRIEQLRGLGHRAHVCSSREQIDQLFTTNPNERET